MKMQSETIKYMYCVVCKNGVLSLDETLNNRFSSEASMRLI